ncbi:glutamine amidotransferase [Microbacterium sp. GXS0129]|uniref:glutamine amidotransferase n=1 Tax=Microbacterium sp. GXS0129 TaxID=3377836 RepID=UPI00383B7D90
MARVLLAGESWSTTSIHTKGFDSFITSAYAEGGTEFIAALREAGHEVTFQPNHVAADHFPWSAEELAAFDVVVLSDIGANTLLLPNDVFARGQVRPNRLQVLADWVRAGGSLLMVGGYLSFQGIEAKANYRATPIAEILPIEMEVGDDREETPQGAAPRVIAEHAITAGMREEWPVVLGYHRLQARTEAAELVAVDGSPFVVVGEAGAGRTAVFASDMGPHWLPDEFRAWDGFTTIWDRLVRWLARES